MTVGRMQITLGEHCEPRKTRQDSSSLGSAARRLTLSRWALWLDLSEISYPSISTAKATRCATERLTTLGGTAPGTEAPYYTRRRLRPHMCPGLAARRAPTQIEIAAENALLYLATDGGDGGGNTAARKTCYVDGKMAYLSAASRSIGAGQANAGR
eukprot:scaffold94828_cov68-Phaeocystis_antarctica.AAC.1